MIRAMHPDSRAADERSRSRALGTYFAAVALSSISYIATFTVAALAAPEITGSAASSGLPGAVAPAGTAIAAGFLSSLMARRGRRFGLAVGIAVASVGAVLAAVSVMVASLPLLLVASAAAGFGNASLALSRYAAAEMYPPARRASALGFVVWGSTIGAVVGPNLVGPAAGVATSMGLTPLAGGFAATVVFMVAALAVILLGPRAPAEPHPDQAPEARVDPAAPRASVVGLLGDLLRQPWGRTAVGALIGAQVVMSMIMTMTPFHLHEHGHDLGVVGFVISAHVLGMFAFAPISGRLTDRFGADAMVLAGFGTLTAAGVMAAVMPGGTGSLLGLPLFLLGLGWNMAFVAGSSLLALRIVHDRARLQGAIDATIWLSGAASSLASGVVVAAAGYTTLAVTGAALAVVVIGLALVDQRQVRAATG